MISSRSSALTVLNWYENASREEVYELLDPVIYGYKPADLANKIDSSINVVYSYRKQCCRAKTKPSLELFIRMLALL